jgi:hypothetical protein
LIDISYIFIGQFQSLAIIDMCVFDPAEWGPIVGGLRQQSDQTTLMLTVITQAVTHLSRISITIIIHVQCRATLQAIGLYLEAFQKIADAATNSKGLHYAQLYTFCLLEVRVRI